MSNRLEDYNDVGLLFPSEYLAAADLRGREITVVIQKVEPRAKLKRTDGSSDAKPVITFEKAKKKWVLNKTNAKIIAKMHGKPLDWIGKPITLYATTCDAFGDVVDCIRVKAEKPRQQQRHEDPPRMSDEDRAAMEAEGDPREPGSDG